MLVVLCLVLFCLFFIIFFFLQNNSKVELEIHCIHKPVSKENLHPCVQYKLRHF